MKKIKLAATGFVVCLVTSIVLIVTGFLLPPAGVIDGSVLSAVGELFAFATLAQLPSIINGRNVKIEHGNTTITANKHLIEQDKPQEYGTEIPDFRAVEDSVLDREG